MSSDPSTIDPVGSSTVQPMGHREPISLRLIADLHAFAVRHLASTDGQTALAAMGITDRAIIDAYRIGFLPPNFRAALTDRDRRSIAGRPWARALVLPAFDSRGAIVDLLIAQAVDGGHVDQSLWDAPRGMLAPALATAFTSLVITDSLRRVGPLFRLDQPALLLRGAADATTNAARLAAGGVERVEMRVRRDAEAMASALREAGITVDGRAAITTPILSFPVATVVAEQAPSTDATPPPAPATEPAPRLSLELISHDRQHERATFRFGGGLYEVQVPWRSSSVLEVTCRVGERQHRDRLDLLVPAQRRRFSLAAAARTGLAAAEVEVALLLLSEAAPAMGRASSAPPTLAATAGPLADSDREAALAVLRDPRLLERVCTDGDLLGWVGETDAKELVMLAGISRLADEPLWLALTAGAEDDRFPALRWLDAITPTDQVVHVSRLSDAALFNADPDALRHRLLLLDDATAITPTVATALRILHTRGAITGSQVERDVLSGAMRTRFVAAHGPLAVIAAAPGPLPAALRHHLLDVPMDDGPEQASRAVVAHRRRLAGGSMASEVERCAALWRRALGLLVPAPVIVPAASDVALPPLFAQRRHLVEATFGLIVASALLHQHQRLRSDGALIATPEDIARGIRLAMSLAAQRSSDLSAPARALLRTLWSAGRTTFTMDDLGALLPTWSRWTFRATIDELCRLDCVDAGRSGRGKPRVYTLIASPTASDDAKREVGGLAALGGQPPPSATPGVAHA